MDKLPDKVIELEVLRINRNIDKKCRCYNRTFVVDPTNKIILCGECGARVDPYEAIYDLAYNRERMVEENRRLLEQRKQIESYKPFLVVIKELEKKYRNKNELLPCCPHCHRGIYLKELLAESTSKQFEDRRRKKEDG